MKKTSPNEPKTPLKPLGQSRQAFKTVIATSKSKAAGLIKKTPSRPDKVPVERKKAVGTTAPPVTPKKDSSKHDLFVNRILDAQAMAERGWMHTYLYGMLHPFSPQAMKATPSAFGRVNRVAFCRVASPATLNIDVPAGQSLIVYFSDRFVNPSNTHVPFVYSMQPLNTINDTQANINSSSLFGIDPSQAVGLSSGAAKMAYLFGGAKVRAMTTQNGVVSMRVYAPAERNNALVGSNTDGSGLTIADANGLSAGQQTDARPTTHGGPGVEEHQIKPGVSHCQFRLGMRPDAHAVNPWVYEQLVSGPNAVNHQPLSSLSADLVPFIEIVASGAIANVSIQVIHHYSVMCPTRSFAKYFGSIEPNIRVDYSILTPPGGISYGGCGTDTQTAMDDLKQNKTKAIPDPRAKEVTKLPDHETTTSNTNSAPTVADTSLENHIVNGISAAAIASGLWRNKHAILSRASDIASGFASFITRGFETAEAMLGGVARLALPVAEAAVPLLL